MDTRDATTDEALFLRFRAGDPTAFLTLYRRYDPRVEARVRGRLSAFGLGRAEATLEICQNIWLDLSKGELRPGGVLRAWLFRVTDLKVADYARSVSRGRDLGRRLSPMGETPPPEAFTEPELPTPKLDVIAEVRAAIDEDEGMSPNLAAVLHLWLDGFARDAPMTHEEIAQTLRITVPNSRARLKRGLQRLREGPAATRLAALWRDHDPED